MKAGTRILLLLLASTQTGCSRAPDPDLALVIDGMEVRRGEWDEFLPFYKGLEPQRGEQTIRQRLLDGVLQMKLARRWHGDRLDAEFAKATELARICREQGAPALTRYGGTTEPEPVTPGGLPPALARAAFALEEGQVSNAIQLPEGAAVIGVLQKTPGAAPLLDRVRLVTVSFFVSPQENLKKKLGAGVRALKGKISYVAKDLQDAVPAFLRSDAP